MLIRLPQLARRASPLLTACALLLLSPPAAAGPGARARLDYQRLTGAESCPAQPAFQAEIAAWLGYDPFSDSEPRAVVIELSGNASGLAAHLQLEKAGGEILGERQIVTASSDCRDLTQALVLAVALAVDPLPISRDVIVSDEARPPPAVQVVSPTTTFTIPAASTRPAGPSAELSLSVGSLWVVGGPQVAPGLMAGLEARWDHFSIGIEGEGDAFTGEPVSPGSVQVSLVSAELIPCYRLGAFGFCAVLAAGAELGHGEGVSEPSSQPLPYLGVGVRALADLHIAGPLSVRFQLDALGTALGATFNIGNTDVWDTPALTFQAAAALVLRL